jgi:hypothetical protein
MFDAPPIVEQLPAISQEEVLTVYASYHYGFCPLRHSSERLSQFADAAMQYKMLTIANSFEKLVDWAEREEEKQLNQEWAEQEAHIEHLRHDYR